MVGSLERAVLRISRTGWLLQGLSRSPFNGARPWSCDLIPGHLGGIYQWGEKVRSGPGWVYPNSQARIVADGETALEAVENALAALDKSPARAVYLDLERAIEDAVNGRNAGT